MFVVMARTAGEAELLGVKSAILGEGLTPYDHAGAERTVIAVIGEIGSRKAALMSRLGGLPGVETVTPISRPFKLTSREFQPENTVIRVLDAVIGDGSLTRQLVDIERGPRYRRHTHEPLLLFSMPGMNVPGR